MSALSGRRIFLLILRMEYKITACGDLNNYYDSLKNIVYSLRPLTQSEINAFTVNRVRLVKTNKEETVKELFRRTNNVWSSYYPP